MTDIEIMSGDASETTRHVARWIVFLARVGYAAKGVVYIVVGALAARAAVGGGGRLTGTKGALHAIGEGPFGTAALITVAAGLLGYALWRLINAITDAERKGDEPTGLMKRAGGAVRGLAYGGLGAQTIHFLATRDEGDGREAETMTARVMTWPAGRWLVILVGLGFLGYGAYQLYRAGSNKVLKNIDTLDAGAEGSRWIKRFGRFGIAARAVVFAMIGALLMRAAWKFNPAAAGGIDDSLSALAHGPRGALVLGIVAAGLVSYGLFQLATARYRFMRIS